MPNLDQILLQKLAGKRQRTKQSKDLAYVQDFTSKIVGFEPVKVSEAQAVKLAQKVQTGFEVRVPIIVTKNKDAKRLKKLLAQ